ncbi:hypothetical protein TVAG_456360 [Trichomonas vaginalis G3]|uniref:BAR domain-containing protein n=2 Tax=Trichomonas vaginalis (strain ATCC PRA-98 / G3) TaxID=412133 RepID=A2DBW0_TRIV3|nr:hypothetical protein TVAGG3_0264460 [Trichomonas vaginalis G3]EAY22001.1 hypothetical protein TVAG_456360 [Trichomonas vaginalis G3]KAI5525372.1 hypothetical protein TVAGG3_0264460 [Trichomonas vaginalis G3]|eukprot:XP_001582987.1 hypothetical protein [Trichomonas vaginalis G3]
MKSVWDSTKAAFNSAKSAVKDNAKKLATKVKEASTPEDPMGFRVLLSESQELKREAKTCANKIQVIRINILNVASTIYDIATNTSEILQTEESLQYKQSIDVYHANMKKLADELLPLYVEKPYDDVLKMIKELSPLFKEVSDIHDKITLNKAINKAQSAISEKSAQKSSDKIADYNKQLQDLHSTITEKLTLIDTEMANAKRKSFLALTFYFEQFITASEKIGLTSQ